MSYQLSATPDMDISASEQKYPRMYRYAVASVVLFYNKSGVFEFVCYDVSIQTEINESRAIDNVFQLLCKQYRECNGYIVRVKAERIPE